MWLAEFLIAVLEAQGRALQQLSENFGEEVLVEILERAGERDPEIDSVPLTLPNAKWLAQSASGGDPDTIAEIYRDLQMAVHKLKIHTRLEFHLWALPYYRLFIESSAWLDATPGGPEAQNAWKPLIEQAFEAGSNWPRTLGLSEPFLADSLRAVQSSWLRFRAEMLKKAGNSWVDVL